MDYYLSQKGLIVFRHDVLHPGSMCYFFGIHGDGGDTNLKRWFGYMSGGQDPLFMPLPSPAVLKLDPQL